MNNLSWFIYVIQLVDDLVSLFIWGAALCAVTGVVRVIVTIIRAESAFANTSSSGGADVAARKAVWEAFNPMIGRFLAGTVAVALVAAVLPSRQTLLMIAGSEAGERLVMSEGVNSIVNPGMDLIRKWIKQEADKIKDKS